MKKAKVIIKQKGLNIENGLVYITKSDGPEYVCFTMALGYAVHEAKQNGMSLSKIKALVTDMYKEREENDNED